MKILVLGAYGLIGQSVTRALVAAGHTLVGLGRDAGKGQALLPDIDWIGADLAQLTSPEGWTPHLQNMDAVVNCAGLLEAGAAEMAAVQHHAIVACLQACETLGVGRFVQISAPDARLDSSTAFFRTKAAADAALKQSGLDWTIFRPGLVMAPTVYGGTALVRMLAAFPVVQPLALAGAKLQVVAAEDVADAVALALDAQKGAESLGGDFDLVAEPVHSLEECVAAVRAWLGFPKPSLTLRLPSWFGMASARLGDLAGRLGWRPALRSPGLKVLMESVTGNPAPWAAITGQAPQTLANILKARPATQQDRVAARAALVFPLALICLSAFFIATGVIALMRFEASVAVLPPTMPLPALFVGGGALADIGLGLLMLYRKAMRWAVAAGAGLSVTYLLLGSVLTPYLWADPMGPLLKAVPVIILALTVWALGEER